MSPSPHAPRRDLEAWLAARLRPLDDGDETGPRHSDCDLNVDLDHRARPLARAAVLVALIEREGALHVLLTRRAETLTRHSGQIAFPGGRLDPGETVVAAALREAQEEIGLDPRLVHPVGLGDVYETVTGFAVTPVVAFVDAGFALHAAEAEVAEVFDAPFAWLMNPHNVTRGVGEFRGRPRAFDSLHHGNRMIWGATAGMLGGLRRRVFGN